MHLLSPRPVALALLALAVTLYLLRLPTLR